jgi:hypothetical protein
MIVCLLVPDERIACFGIVADRAPGSLDVVAAGLDAVSPSA